ncbi:flagellar basal body-associated FliL family protein [Rhizorhapis sp. SPR117]|uniref:flagellar basal body-associated FliL family protein n=1 Tax=Rhizorhapis sp. SPR117 TaxID=2912611 RepID=UPI001F29546A|nr:flagellar basal body-associated FliL family protein [Rhizorhapis sp. SPR117]
MSDETIPQKKGGKRKKWMILIGLVVLLGGAGVGGALFAMGILDGKTHAEAEDVNKPKLVLKGEGAPAGEGEKAEPVIGTVAGNGSTPKDASKYQATYYQIEAPFTSNLRDSGSFAQISIAIATYYDSRVLQNIKQHEIAVRSAALMRIADQDELELSTPEGKERLQAELKAAINHVLIEKAGFGGIDNVYFTNFVIQ